MARTSSNSGVNLPRDVFMHLLAIITLIASAVSFGIIVFEFINIQFPDIVSDPYFSLSSHLSVMRSALAALVIVFPVFLWASWFIRKDIAKFPDKKDLKIRKWLLYLTLFVSAMVIIGDLVALVRSFLEGELSQRFVLKVVVILFIAGSAFFHYLQELKEAKGKSIRIFDWTVISIILATIVYGFFVAGSPQNQRLVRLDERRISDLQNIQWQIINYWQRKSALPLNLKELEDSISGFIVPRDPISSLDYVYKQTGSTPFELCAFFSTSTSESYSSTLGTYREKPLMPVSAGHAADNNWSHYIGEGCFYRIIDPQLYPPIKDANIVPKPI